MVVVDKRIEENVRLSDLHRGDTFMLIHELDLVLDDYIEVQQLNSPVLMVTQSPIYNINGGLIVPVVCLNNGIDLNIQGDTKVKPIEVELTIVK